MKTIDYEVIEREPGMPRPGWYALRIEGEDVDVTVDPSQWLKLGLKLAAAAGKKGPEMAAHADHYCRQRAAQSLERRAMRLQEGRRPGGHGLFAGTADEMRKRPDLISGAEAAELYRNRGKLAGLDKKQRLERLKRKAQKFDNDKDWAARRAKLIEECRAEIKAHEAILKADSGNPKSLRMLGILKQRLEGLKPKIVNVIHGFQYAYTQYWAAAINLSTDDIRLWPYMTNTTLDTVRDAVDAYGDVTLDEFDGSGYASGGLALDGQTVAVDDANDRAEFDCSDEVVVGLGAGTRQMQGVSPGKFNTNTTLSLPLHAIDFTTNKTPDGSDFTFAINAEGLLQLADG